MTATESATKVQKSLAQETADENKPASERALAQGRNTGDPLPGTGPRRLRRPRARRFAFSGTSDPLNAIAPDPPTYLTTDLQQKQGAIRDYVSRSIKAMWDQHIDPENFSASWTDLGPIIKTLIAQHFDASAAQAAEFYRNYTVVNGLPFPLVSPARFSGQHLNRMAGSVANGTFYHHLNTKGVDPGPASDSARNVMSGAGARFALNGARNTVIAAVARDPNATGWDRLLEPGACTYCMSQAAKGPFKSSNTGFRAHDNCTCLAMPVLRGATHNPNAHLRDQWNKITGTMTGKEARATWDRYWSEHGSDQNPATRDGSGPGQTEGEGPGDGPSQGRSTRRQAALPGAKRGLPQEGNQGSRTR